MKTLILLVALTLTACGGGEDSEPTPAPSTLSNPSLPKDCAANGGFFFCGGTP